MTQDMFDGIDRGTELMIIGRAYEIIKSDFRYEDVGSRFKGQTLVVSDEEADPITLNWRHFIRAAVKAEKNASAPRLAYELACHIKRNQATYDYYKTKKGKYDR